MLFSISFPLGIDFLPHGIQVEDALFKVPRVSFECSELFATIFSLSTANTAVDESDNKHPFKLYGISKLDFQAFLEVLYPW